MFLHDSSIEPIIPPNAGRDPVMSTSTCLAFSVLGYVDGDARVILCGPDYKSLDRVVFSGRILCPSRSISLVDSTAFPFASLPLENDYADVTLRMSNDQNPDVVTCIMQNLHFF